MGHYSDYLHQKIDSHKIVCPICQEQIVSSSSGRGSASFKFRQHLLLKHSIEDYISFLREVYYPSIGLEKEGYCVECGNLTKFYNFEVGFWKYCSKQCRIVGSSRNREQTNITVFGSKHPLQNKKILSKLQATCLEKYGNVCSLHGAEVDEKVKRTNIERYGVDRPAKNKEIQGKVRQTCQEKYGCDCVLQSPIIKDKIKNTNLKKYGVSCVAQSQEIREKQIRKRRTGRFETFVSLLEAKGIIPLFSKEYYINKIYNSNYRYKCVYCNNEFESIQSGAERVNCPVCVASKSTLENEIYGFLVEFIDKVDVVCNSKSILKKEEKKKGQELDIYLPKYKLAIEMDGLYDDKYHLGKTELAESKGIRLLHITDYEWNEKKDICKSIIKSALGFTEKIYARKCEIRELANQEYIDFCLLNHIQGSVYAKTKLGLFYDNKLVQVCSFGKSRFCSNETELLRHCSLLNTTVVGGFSKLVSFYVQNYNPSKLITFCDRRFFTGKGYLATGWRFLYNTKPNYWYFSKKEYYLQSRVKYQKHKLKDILPQFDPNLSELDNMLANGYMRYYDCGSIKLEHS